MCWKGCRGAAQAAQEAEFSCRLNVWGEGICFQTGGQERPVRLGALGQSASVSLVHPAAQGWE